MRRWLYRFVTWGDRRHWELTIGRLSVDRWCEGAPCGLPNGISHRHPVGVRIWRRCPPDVDTSPSRL